MSHLANKQADKQTNELEQLHNALNQGLKKEVLFPFSFLLWCAPALSVPP